MVEFYQLPLKERELKFVSRMLAVKMSIANLNIFKTAYSKSSKTFGGN